MKTTVIKKKSGEIIAADSPPKNFTGIWDSSSRATIKAAIELGWEYDLEKDGWLHEDVSRAIDFIDQVEPGWIQQNV